MLQIAVVWPSVHLMYWLPTCEQCQGCGDCSRVIRRWLCLAIHFHVAAQDAAAGAARAIITAAAVAALVAIVKEVQELPAATANALQQERQQ
jgi:hypothetical protein